MAQVLLTCTLFTSLPSKKVTCAHDERYAKDAWSSAGCFEQDPESTALQYRIIGGKPCIELCLDDIPQYVKDYIVNGVCIAFLIVLVADSCARFFSS
jgi:hypothetical protein